MYKYRRFKTPYSKGWISPDYLKQNIVREPTGKLERLHPNAKRVYNRMTQEPEPLTYKLQDAELIKDKEIPLGNTISLPFQILRTHTNNLPVYTEYKDMGNTKKTIVRLVSGDIDEFKREISKIVSNSKVEIKTGKVIISGFHKQKVTDWLRRLGF
jgi:large subunit ribosomal protein L49